jgi:predicted metallopeptidase
VHVYLTSLNEWDESHLYHFYSFINIFREGVSSISCEKSEKPVIVEILTILIFMAGVLMVGFSQINFKITYLVGHASQAVVIALANGSKLNICSVNGVTWQVENHEELLERRRNAYTWVTRNTNSREVAWLKELIYNPNFLVELVREEVKKDDIKKDDN